MNKATVGWLFSDDLSAVIYYPPERLDCPKGPMSGGAASCPAIADMARHYYVIRSPFTISLRCTHLVPGKEFYYDLVPVEGEKIRGFGKALTVTHPSVWENPAHPTLQLALPYVFISDESVFVEQTPPYFSEIITRLPLQLYGGRFPIDVWPRLLNFSFQWIDTKRDILIRRGDPLFYVRFFPSDRNRGIQLVECERTRELESFMAAVRDVTTVTTGAYSLFGRAAELRPPTLIVPKVSYKPHKRVEDNATGQPHKTEV